jgi:hypothetical protein
MKRTFRTALARLLALGALSGAPVAQAQPRDITLPELLGGPHGDAIREPDTMPVPKPTAPRVDDDGQPIAGKPAARLPPRAPATQAKQAAKTPPPAVRSAATAPAREKVVVAKPKPAAKSNPARPTATASARAKTPPAATSAPPLRAVRIGRTAQQAAPGHVPLPDDAASAPNLSALPEPQIEVAQEQAAPEAPAIPEAQGQALQASGEADGFGPEFAEIEATIQRGARRGDFSRREAASLYAELDDIAAMDDFITRTGRGDRARVADRLVDLRNYLADRTPY